MAITAGGVGSGLDINGIVSQLMAIERQAIYKAEAQKREFNTQLSAYGKLSSEISSFQDAMDDLGSLEKFKIFETTSSNEDVLTATSDSDAAAGIYSIEVTRLAQNHKMGSNEIDKADSFSGNLVITVDSVDLTLDTTGKTLSEIRDAINTDSGNPGVTATILNTGGDNQRLILTADESGADQSITVNETAVTNTTSGTALNLTLANRDTDGVLLGSTAELDAAYKVDGYDLTASSNNISDTIDGITLELQDVGSSTLKLSRDTSTIEENVKTFVDAYNSLQSKIDSLGENELSGETTLFSIKSQLRTELNTAVSGLTGTYSSLAELGIMSDAKTGDLSLDSARLSEALDTDFQSVAELFAHDDQGYAYRFSALASDFLDEDRGIDLRKSTLNDRIDDTDDSIADIEYRLELKERSLRAEFAALDTLVAGMQQTSSFLARFG